MNRRYNGLAAPEASLNSIRWLTWVELTPQERQGLEILVRQHTTPQQIALRARIILAAADGFNNTQVARQLGVNVNTVSLWRNRWLGLAAASLDDLSIQLTPPVLERLLGSHHNRSAR